MLNLHWVDWMQFSLTLIIIICDRFFTVLTTSMLHPRRILNMLLEEIKFSLHWCYVHKTWVGIKYNCIAMCGSRYMYLFIYSRLSGLWICLVSVMVVSFCHFSRGARFCFMFMFLSYIFYSRTMNPADMNLH